MSLNKLYKKYITNQSQFEIARLRLTGLYLVIIMAVSILFSVATFRQQESDLINRFGRFQSFIHQYEIFFPGRTLPQGVPDIEESLNELKLSLLYLNIVILGLSAAAGYFLAGRTLRPIQKSLDDQARFVADASHEMRTPLTALKTSTEVALRDKNLTPKEAHSLLSSNLQKINDLQSLTESLLILAQDGELPESLKQPVDLNEVVSLAIAKITPAAKAKEISLTSKLPKLDVNADPKSLTELFVILLDNAVKYNPAGTAAQIHARTIDHRIEVVVQDNGIGIKHQDLPNLFDRFYRADVSRSKDVPGYGLGLSIAKKIVESFGGSISVRSQLGSGTSFLITLPKT